MAARLEHANISVGNIDEAIRFITAAFPEFAIRGRGEVDGRPWVHIGTASSYLALNEYDGELPAAKDFDSGPLNHLGFVIDDAAALESRMNAAGYREGFVAPPHKYRIRKYFLDADDVEWEFVQYLTEDPALQNEYS